MKKICYIATIAGSVRILFKEQLQYLSKNGFEVYVICSSDDNLQEDLGKKIKFIPVDMPRGIGILGSISAICRLIHLFKTEKFDIIQYSTPNAAFYASIASFVSRAKVRNYHLMGFRYLGAHGFTRVILKLIEILTCKLSTTIECVSKSNLELGVSEGIFQRKKATVVWNGSTGGLNIERFNPNNRLIWRKEIREKYNINAKSFIYGFVGRVTRDKGINELLSAFEQIQGDYILMIVGDQEGIGTLIPNIYLNSLKNNRIIYTGAVTDVEKYYAAFDVLVFPSYREGFGNVVMEAAAVGTPAIITKIPGPIDVVEVDKTALLIKSHNIKDLIEKMIEITKKDYLAMGVEASKYVIEKFDSDILNERILERKQNLLVEE